MLGGDKLEDIIAMMLKEIDDEFDFLQMYYNDNPAIKDMLHTLNIKVRNIISKMEEEGEEIDPPCKM